MSKSWIVCVCGHVIEEHNRGFIKECSLCDCLDFEGEEESEDEEDVP